MQIIPEDLLDDAVLARSLPNDERGQEEEKYH